MKKTIVISLIALATTAQSQIKVFPSNLHSYGSTTSPASNVNHQFTGSLAVSESGSTSSGCALLKANGTTSPSAVGRPDYTWLGDATTGIFHPGSSLIGLTVDGGEKFRFNSAGQILSSATQAIATPAYSWTVDPNTGLYNPAADIIGFVTNGTEKFRINSAGQLLNYNTASTASTPDYSWIGSTSTGIFHGGSSFIGFSVAGTEICRIISNGQILSSKVTSSASTPDYSWNNAPGTGMYLVGTNLLGFSVNGAQKFTINNSGQMLGGSGSPSTPLYSWSGDVNTGFFNPSPDVLAVSTGGAERMRISDNGNILMGTTSDDTYQKCLITGASDKRTLSLYDTHTYDYGYSFVSHVNRTTTKAIAAYYNGTEKFTVLGNGDVYSATNYYYSDRTLKDNIDSIPDALSKILQLKGVTYNFKAEQLNSNAMQGTVLPATAPKKQIGLIAQDVELVLPEIVATTDQGIKAVAYQMLVPMLIEAIKSQNKTITTLQNDVSNCCSKPSDGKTNRTIKNDDGSLSNEDTQSYMKQNKPNPFNKETVIEYNIVESGKASILVFDMNGRLLKTIPVKIPGQGSVTINASDFKSGMYYYSLIVNDTEVDTKKMILTE